MKQGFLRRYLRHGLVLTVTGITPMAQGADAPRIEYPPAARGTQVDRFHGVDVPDPYRWLETVDSPQTRAWIDAQSRLARSRLDALPGRDELRARLERIWNFERWTPPVQKKGRWFFTHNDGLQNQNILFTTEDPFASARVLLDPNTLSADGTVALKGATVSDDARLLLYQLSDGGSDWEVLKVRDVASGKDLPDEIHWAKFTQPSWLHDASGFYYSGYDPPPDAAALKAVNEYHKLFFHKLGTPQAQDTLVYARRDAPDWGVDGKVTEDGHYLVVTSNKGTDVRNTVLVQDLREPGAALVPVIAEPDATYDVVGSVGDRIYVRTDRGASRYRIVAIDLRHVDEASWKTVVPESADTLRLATLVGGQVIARYLHEAHSLVQRFSMDGALLGTVGLPGLGSADGFQGRSADRTTYFRFESYTTPDEILQLDLQDGSTRLWRKPDLKGFDADEYETTLTYARSKDGTRVPVFITARKGTPRDGKRPTILFGYGGFNIPVIPAFSPRAATWLAMGGVYAVANLRGGGEFGREWHEAGMKTHKQNVFDDFIGAAQYLESEKWTDPHHLAIIGGSNGGLLVAAVEEQRSELFAAAVPSVGVLDMLRFREFTIGKAWESDYGSVDNEDEFRAMLAYSPLQNVRPGIDYPATLIMTGDRDDRVFPAHSFKFGAAMQYADPSGRPILVRIATRAGHGQGKPTSKLIDESVDMIAFILHAFE
jgi:prolyl oligopeptidase